MFEIPPYQRPFCWSTKQVHELLQDFMASYRARSEYFLGAIVTVRGDPDANSAFTPLQVRRPRCGWLSAGARRGPHHSAARPQADARGARVAPASRGDAKHAGD